MNRTKFQADSVKISLNHFQEPISIPYAISKLILSQDSPGDILALYWILRLMGQSQSQPMRVVSIHFIASQLVWEVKKVNMVFDKLKKLGLITSKNSEIQNHPESIEVTCFEPFIKVPEKINFTENKETEQEKEKEKKVDKKKNKEKEKEKEKKDTDFARNFPVNLEVVLEGINEKINPSHFERFWAMYPRKESKTKAREVWNRICIMTPSRIPEWRTVKKSIIQFKKCDQWQDLRFVPHPTTWLNQRRWEDEPVISASGSSGKPKPGNGMGYVSESNQNSVQYREDGII